MTKIMEKEDAHIVVSKESLTYYNAIVEFNKLKNIISEIGHYREFAIIHDELIGKIACDIAERASQTSMKDIDNTVAMRPAYIGPQ